MKLTEKLVDAITGEETIIERDETAQETAEREAFEAKVTQLKTESEERATAKTALLAQLGITEEQAKLLLS